MGEQGHDEHPNRERLDALFRSDAYGTGLGAELVDWGGGRAEVAWTPQRDHVNFTGVVHGGAIFSAGDVAFAVASNSWGRVAVALTVDAHFLAAPDPGEVVTARGTERSRTRRTASYLIEIEQGGRAVGSLHAMVYRLDRWHFGAHAWPDEWRAAH